MKRLAGVLVFMAGVLWGSMGIFVRIFEKASLGAMEIVAMRAITTTLILFIFILIYDRKLLKIRWKDLWCFLGTGILSIIFFNFCFFKAISMLTLSMAAVLLYTAPAFVIVFSYFLFGEDLNGRKLLAMILTFIGCVLVTGMLGESGGISMEGILLGLGSGLGYAMYTIFGRYALEKDYHSFTISFYTFFIASIGVIPLADMPKVIQICSRNVTMIGVFLVLGAIVMCNTGKQKKVAGS